LIRDGPATEARSLSPLRGYQIHTSQKQTLLQWVSRTPALSHQVLPQSKQVTLMTHIFVVPTEKIESEV
jgi:hypothetical protein